MSAEDRVKARNKGRDAIADALRLIHPEDRITVLEDVLFVQRSIAKGTKGAPRRRGRAPKTADAAAPEGRVPLWRHIETYCEENGKPGAVHAYSDAAAVLRPNKPKASAQAEVYTAIKRKPDRFEVLGDGKFRQLVNGAAVSRKEVRAGAD